MALASGERELADGGLGVGLGEAGGAELEDLALGAAGRGPQQLEVVVLVHVAREEVQSGQGDLACGDLLEGDGEASPEAGSLDAAVGFAVEEAELARAEGVHARESTLEMKPPILDVGKEDENLGGALALAPDGGAGGIEQLGIGEFFDIDSGVHGRPPESGNPLIPLGSDQLAAPG